MRTAILVIGLGGLAVSFGGGSADAPTAEQTKVLNAPHSDGKIQNDKMILHLNQRGEEEEEEEEISPARVARF